MGKAELLLYGNSAQCGKCVCICMLMSTCNELYNSYKYKKRNQYFLVKSSHQKWRQQRWSFIEMVTSEQIPVGSISIFWKTGERGSIWDIRSSSSINVGWKSVFPNWKWHIDELGESVSTDKSTLWDLWAFPWGQKIFKGEWKLLSCVWLSATPWKSMEFSSPEYWSG